MLSLLPGHFLVGTENAKLLWLWGGGAGNIIIRTVIIEGIKEESPTEKLPEKQRHSEFQAGHSHPCSLAATRGRKWRLVRIRSPSMS